MASLASSTATATATATTTAATVTRVETGAASEEPPCKGSDVEAEGILKLRRQHMADNLSISYRTPLHIVRGSGQYLFSSDGTQYTDCVNNVCHVGHCHPTVVRAACKQLATLNTNTRYLHHNVVNYAKAITATLPAPLDVAFFTCSGSEANELALRLARAYTGRHDVLVVDGAYHGNTNTLIDCSPYKFKNKGGQGQKPFVHVTAMPDPYFDPPSHIPSGRSVGEVYADDVKQCLDNAGAKGRRVGAFFCESLLGCGGQVALPEGYMKAAFQHVREHGGVCIADEVQVGFGRVGSAFWGFQLQDGAVPDIVTMGKPIGNGFPLGCVVTSRKIADSFANGMEYFNTFGGNPVACAVGLAVLKVIKEEELQRHALEVSTALIAGLKALMSKHLLIGQVRGAGLFLGVELVTSRRTRAPAPKTASEAVQLLVQRHRFLLSTDGPRNNVIKFKPPLCFSAADAKALVTALDDVLSIIEAAGGVGGEGCGSDDAASHSPALTSRL